MIQGGLAHDGDVEIPVKQGAGQRFRGFSGDVIAARGGAEVAAALGLGHDRDGRYGIDKRPPVIAAEEHHELRVEGGHALGSPREAGPELVTLLRGRVPQHPGTMGGAHDHRG